MSIHKTPEIPMNLRILAESILSHGFFTDEDGSRNKDPRLDPAVTFVDDFAFDFECGCELAAIDTEVIRGKATRRMRS